MPKRKVLLIDGHSLAYRAFFALPDSMSTTGGQSTNAVFGFTSMLLKVLDEEKPDAVLVAFDGPRSELKRTKEYPEYKAQRPPMPDELRKQMEMIHHLLEHMKIPTACIHGYEADDILGTVAGKVSHDGDVAVILTGDRDILQLAGEDIRVVMTGRGITETESFDRRAVEEKYGVTPEQIPDVAGLKGDSSDNIPGVPGIGKKGAVELIKEYGSLESLYKHLDEVTASKRKKTLEENREIAFLSKALATIDVAVPMELDIGKVEFGKWDSREVLDYLSALEFKTLARRFLAIFGPDKSREDNPEEIDLSYSLVDLLDTSQIESMIHEVESAQAVAVTASLSGAGYCDVSLRALALASENKVLIVQVDGGGLLPDANTVVSRIMDLKAQKWFFDAKSTLLALEKAEIEVRNVMFDTGIAAYLENPSLGSYDLWDLWERNVGKKILIDGRIQAEIDQASLLPVEEEEDIQLAADAARVFHLRPVLTKKLEQLGMSKLFDELEMPLMLVLKDMEKTGVALDVGVVEELKSEVEKTLKSLERDIYELAGHEFNIGSTKQIAQVLFEEMEIPPVKKIKTGFSTDSSVLELLRQDYAIAGKIIEYREYAKLKSTYLDALPVLVCQETDRIHCSFNQTATATGRISSSNPNMQNIPVRTEIGRRIRRGFVPGQEDWKLLVADYSQIELRVLAHMSGDEHLLDSFSRDVDIHRETAAEIFAVSPVEVTGEQRRMAKVVNFGVVYGMGNYGLSSRLGISLEQATRYIDTYFEKYPGVKVYRDRCVEEATMRGYAETLLGRRRYITQLASSNRQTRELGERLAINTPLQGTAADIIKKAMIDVSSAIEESQMASRMTMQIHDELIFEVPPQEVEVLESLVRKLMSGAMDLKVHLKVDVGVHDNWGQAK